MNTLFDKLLAESHLLEKDKHDIKQIFYLLSNEKKQRLMSNFKTLCHNIECINADIEIEQRILFDNLVTDLEGMLEKTKKSALKRETSDKIQYLKGSI